MKPFYGVIVLFACLCASRAAFGKETVADSVRISLSEAENRFLTNNLQLLAARFDIDAATAGIVQAELWTNPNIAIEQNIRNQFTRRWFDVTSTGNTEIQIQQLFLLAGKRDKQIKLAQVNAKIAEQTLYDLLRALKLELRTDIFGIAYLQQSLAFYDESIKSMSKTVAALESMYEKRSVLLSDVLRLKSLLFSLQHERLACVNQVTELQESLRTLLHDTTQLHSYYIVDLNSSNLDSLRVDAVRLEDALTIAAVRRPDYQIAGANVEYEMTNLSLQKALGVPDVTLGGRWSRQGSYIPNYFGLTLSVDIPVFNRNQGNVLMSERILEANKLLRDNMKQTIKKEVLVAYRKAVDVDHLYRAFDKKFTGEYKSLIEGMVASYQKRNISLIEFTDFYESYRTCMVQWHQLQSDRAEAIEGLNYAVGSTVLSIQ